MEDPGKEQKAEGASAAKAGPSHRSVLGQEDQWVAIQHKTFANWVNEQLQASGRSVENLATDLSDGVKLVALLEALQFKKIGRVYKKPTSRIQMLENVGLAFKAITEDHIRLVNIGSEDVVNGNLKLILGLLWHLILRYQISSSKTKAPPKKLMLAWFQSVLPDLRLTNFTTDWNDGIALHALIEYCKPGTCPNWKNLDPKNKVENCRAAMALAKQHLNVPKVIGAEDLASSALDELSAMTYLSYFIRRDSPGYYATLNWVCRKLRTTAVSNLSTDWNDGYYLCAIVNSLGGEIEGWPNLDRSDRVGNIQKGLDGAAKLGVEPVLTAAEMADPNVDHLALMAFVSKFQSVTPRKVKAEKLTLDVRQRSLVEGQMATLAVEVADVGVERDKVAVKVEGPDGNVTHNMTWRDTAADVTFTPAKSGEYTVRVHYDGEEVVGSPVLLSVSMDTSKARLLTPPSPHCRVGDLLLVQVDLTELPGAETKVEVVSPAEDTRALTSLLEHNLASSSLRPKSTGLWKVHVYVEGQEIGGSPIHVTAFDPNQAWLKGPTNGVVKETVTFTVNMNQAGSEELTVEVADQDGHDVSAEVKDTSEGKEVKISPMTSGRYALRAKLEGFDIKGSPLYVEVVDPGRVLVSGEGVERAVKGEEAVFNVSTAGLGGSVTVEVINASGSKVDTRQQLLRDDCFEFRYLPWEAGVYDVHVRWNGHEVKGSPFKPAVTDRSCVTLLTELRDLMDENDHLALECDVETRLVYDVSKAGPGRFTAEVLGPEGKLPVAVEQSSSKVDVVFTARDEGDHYIHLFWSEVPLVSSPILAYCPGPRLPLDASRVAVTGRGAETARATVPTEFLIDGRRAGPGVIKVRLQGLRQNCDVEVKPLKYDRYQCFYTPPLPGGYLLYIYWSEELVPGCPFKLTVTSKGDVSKVRVTGEGLRGGIAGHELKVFVDTRDAGPGDVTAVCMGARQGARCELRENEAGHYTLRIFPTVPEKHLLQVKYDDHHVPGSPFLLRVGEPPDPSKVKVFGPGVEAGLIQTFESRFLVETHGAGAGQLAVKIRGPKGGFRVDIQREAQSDRTITCRYDPQEPGHYVINVRWSGEHVPGSPFDVHIFETREEHVQYLAKRGLVPEREDDQWRAEI